MLSRYYLEICLKYEIYESVHLPETPLTILVQKLEVEWPALFMTANEDELFEKYALLTWHTEPEDREYLQKHLSNHPEYQQYVQMHKAGLLPAQDYTIQDIVIDYKEQNDEFRAIFTYALTLRDGSKTEITVTLPQMETSKN